MFHDDYGPHGFEALAINLSEDMEAIVKPWARQYHNVYLRDPGTVWNVYKHNGSIPLNYVVDTAGVIRFWQEGYTEATIRSIIESNLPDPIEHDVGVSKLIAPTGSRDSGTVVTPACSLYNYRSYAETYPVRMRIGTMYDTSLTVTNHQPGQTVYLEFPQWTALERGNVAVRCSTELADDDITSNDKVATTATVNVFDVAVSAILAPPDSVDSGAVITPMAEIKNFGTMTDLVTVHFRIGSYYDTVRVSMSIGGTDTAALGSWTAMLPGTFPVSCSAASWRGDMVPGNDELSKSTVVLGSGVEEPRTGATGFTLLGSSRNPSVAQTTIRYSLAKESPVDLRIYSTTGKLVRTLHSGVEPAGLHQVVWDRRDNLGRSVGRGTYFCRMAAGSFRTVSKLTTIE
ncbi:MAG: hypothetical protein NTX53_05295 [candidate division WOR-3 bacterium]|nr:hypothetical protein [candidate division WOR-3 bacterium]